MSHPSVLFVCGRNAIRSPMGAALWDQRFGAGSARSCGVIPAAFVDPFMVSVMLEKGIDLEDFSPIALNGVGEPAAQLVVSLSTAAERTARGLCIPHRRRIPGLADPRSQRDRRQS